MVHRLQKICRHDPLGTIAIHAQLLSNNAALPPNGGADKVWRCYKIQKHLQRFGKILGTAKIIGSLIKAGKGVGGGAQRIKALHSISIGAIKHFMFKVVGNTGRQPYLSPPHQIADINGADPDGKHGIGSHKALHTTHLYRQPAGKGNGSGALPQQLRGVQLIIPHRRRPPFRSPAKRIRYPK